MSKLLRIVTSTAALAGVLITGVAGAARPDLLSHIPEDSPYVMAVTERLPDDVLEKIEPAVEQILESYQVILRHAMDEKLAELAADEDKAEAADRYRGLIDEVVGLMSLEGLRSAGIETNALMAFYGYGLLPVLRMELSDEALFDDAVARIEGKAGESLEVGQIGRQTYKFASLEEMKLIVATIDGQAVISLLPSAFGDDHIAAVLGTRKIRDNIKRAKTLRNIARQYGYEDYRIGYLDVRAIANAFIGERSDIDQAVFDALLADGEDPTADLSAVCRAEFLDMAGIAPRMVFGYKNISSASLDSSLVVELREDIAQGLATLPAAVPGLGQDFGGLLSFGMSLNPLALRDFFEARLDAIEADPFECEHLAEMQAIVPQGREVLAQPIPPVVYSFRGFVANVMNVEGLDIANETPPTSVDASILFAAENVEALVMMATMIDPQIAALNLLPDGKPVRLDIEQVTAIVGEAYAAMTQNAISVSVGEGAEQAAADALLVDSTDPAPFMAMSMDSKRYYEMIGAAMMQAEAEGENDEEVPPEVRDAISGLMTVVSDLYERMAFDILFTERGVEFDGRVTLGDGE